MDLTRYENKLANPSNRQGKRHSQQLYQQFLSDAATNHNYEGHRAEVEAIALENGPWSIPELYPRLLEAANNLLGDEE
jgi:hypothetical protein